MITTTNIIIWVIVGIILSFILTIGADKKETIYSPFGNKPNTIKSRLLHAIIGFIAYCVITAIFLMCAK
jgi:hypothetical protein